MNHSTGIEGISNQSSSNGSTSISLWVICSTLVLIHSSATSQIDHLKIHIKVHSRSATFNTLLITGLNCGIFGAGGSVGRVISKSIDKVGSHGISGGAGIVGIEGIISSNLVACGLGKSGSLGSGILTGAKRIFGKIISIPRSIFDKSRVISGI